ncbi:MAG: DUF3800 domain-containing protein [Candidatus Altimarinota bacterium]
MDESGDLGFDFVNKKPSKYFTVTILALSSQEANRCLISAVKKTLKRKLNKRKSKKRMVHELKATSTSFDVKRYFYEQAKGIKWGIYSITLNKKKVYDDLAKAKSRVYNFVSRKVLDQIPFEMSIGTRIELIIDKSKGRTGIVEFNKYIQEQLQARIHPKTPLEIYHRDSQDTPGLQAADLFCWGVFQKYERRNQDWYAVFEDRVLFDDLYLN